MTEMGNISLVVILLLSYVNADLRIFTFPVGQGDSSWLECDDNSGKVIITIINAGSVSGLKRTVLDEYNKFITEKLTNPKYRIENIFLTTPNEDHYNFIQPILDLIKDEEALKIKFYIAGTRKSYLGLDLATKYSKTVYEFTRLNEDGNAISSCGHFPWGDTKKNFYSCMQRDVNGPIPNTNGVIDICTSHQITVMAANYGFSHELGGSINDINSKYENSLVLKLTPRNQPSPSMVIMGDLENINSFEKTASKVFFNYIKGMHWHYIKNLDVPSTLRHGLATSVLMVPQHGADITVNTDVNFISELVKPTYVVISSDIHTPYGDPKCSVIKALNMYLRQYAARDKELQCHSSLLKDIIKIILVAENIFQTTKINTKDLVLQFNLIKFTMTTDQVLSPTSQIIFKKYL